jgi:hypothetical protein
MLTPKLFFPVSASGGCLRVLLVLHDGFVGGHLANTGCKVIHEGIAPQTHYFAADRVGRRGPAGRPCHPTSRQPGRS